ncbi:MAG: hypothetical protein IJF69_00555 [Clostridia bacterium]|nr:hypothetical protein [Clostridia bacterium]
MENQVRDLIDHTIKQIWENDIKADYENGWLLKEDTLKMSFCHYLRMKLENFFLDNDIRIFTEFTDDVFVGSGYRPDIVIAKMNFDRNSEYYGNDVVECLAVLELKYKKGFNASKDIYRDYEKLCTYIKKLKITCPVYMATIWEYEDDETLWERKNAAWAKGKLTELNASYNRESQEKEMRFYVGVHI